MSEEIAAPEGDQMRIPHPGNAESREQRAAGTFAPATGTGLPNCIEAQVCELALTHFQSATLERLYPGTAMRKCLSCGRRIGWMELLS